MSTPAPIPSPSATPPTAALPDVIDLLAGIEPGDHLDTIRRHRLDARTHAQESYRALFAPTAPAPGTVTLAERLAVAAFVAGLHQQADAAAFYAAALVAQDAGAGLAQAIAAEVSRGAAQGPYGHYPAGPLSRENTDGSAYAVGEAQRAVLGLRLSAGLAHAHLLTFHPRDASPEALQALLDAGWSATDVVVLSQLVAFLSFQIRVVVGLRLLAAHPAPAASSSTPHTAEAQP
ncbi:CMD domain protein [Acidovorax sp. NPDC077693]|uniref:CMD domain protein n=1 Tax=unclassified Acidovorax TaxID=2684926 RepID=UPI0037C80184